MHIPFPVLPGLFAACLTLGACVPAPQGENQSAPVQVTNPGDGPANAKPGACYGKDVSPAVVEVVTDQVLIRPAQKTADGTITQPAVYRTETHQAIVQERREIFFEVPCAGVLTPDFVASLQRALKARGIYHGAVTGQLDARTRDAVRRFQRSNGLNTDILTMESARLLGLIAYAR
jgi:hypothetical protein